MKVYWRLKSVPELQGLSARERRWVYRRHAAKGMRNRRGVLVTLVYVTVFCLGMNANWLLFDMKLGPWKSLWVSVPLLVLAFFILEVGRISFSRASMGKEVALWKSVHWEH